MIRPLGDVIILMPPLTIADSELKNLLDVTHDCIRVVTER
jgi:adenosylmethionine---8-amino-7-oxononanoate aminotransferase